MIRPDHAVLIVPERDCIYILVTNAASDGVFYIPLVKMASGSVSVSVSSAKPDLAAKLRQYNITGVVVKGKTLGAGSYGTVEEYEVDGVRCAGKRIYDVLATAGDTTRTYEQECELVAKLKHRNIVKFVGVTLQSESILPVLMMERLACSLHCLLGDEPHIPLGLKVSILTDVARGLSYLHGNKPPIIHRDLSAGNVLVSSELVAKIGDLGNCRIVDLAPHEVAKLSKKPGTAVYMPPEINPDSSASYGPSIDVFSMGHLGLFTIIQVYPSDLLHVKYKDPSHVMLGRTEVQRREKYFSSLHDVLGRAHPLEQLIKECLDDTPSCRPSANALLSTLEHVGRQVHKSSDDQAKLLLMRKLRRNESKKKSVPKSKKLSVQVQDIGTNFLIIPIADTREEFDRMEIVEFKTALLHRRTDLDDIRCIRLLHHGKQLEDVRQDNERTTFHFYNIRPNDTLQFVLRLHGGI